MKIVCIADTHGEHRNIMNVPYGDMIICCGDVMMNKDYKHLVDFFDWMKELPHEYKIFVAGNHDWTFETHPEIARELVPGNIIYLEDNGIEIEGIKFWGTPVQPVFFNWAFNRLPNDIQKHWDMIPDDIDVLITHGPPMNVLDTNRHGFHIGCPRLRDAVFNRIKPKAHIFGHIHEGYGKHEENGILFVNAALLNDVYALAHTPIIINTNA